MGHAASPQAVFEVSVLQMWMWQWEAFSRNTNGMQALCP